MTQNANAVLVQLTKTITLLLPYIVVATHLAVPDAMTHKHRLDVTAVIHGSKYAPLTIPATSGVQFAENTNHFLLIDL